MSEKTNYELVVEVIDEMNFLPPVDAVKELFIIQMSALFIV
ncbi:MAG: hypothetical protein ACOWWH_04840 [Eubacteriaceae bacterium]